MDVDVYFLPHEFIGPQPTALSVHRHIRLVCKSQKVLETTIDPAPTFVGSDGSRVELAAQDTRGAWHTTAQDL